MLRQFCSFCGLPPSENNHPAAPCIGKTAGELCTYSSVECAEAEIKTEDDDGYGDYSLADGTAVFPFSPT